VENVGGGRVSMHVRTTLHMLTAANIVKGGIYRAKN
jgi:hypothetical protein